ncbi:hypothetical protein [Thiosulfatihalobacter marinus]|uniref:hypothetical protein n=1 Tax=Thiosulfatihalobacter marinus TaxID=2792481 RepID=UPI0018D91992|nr:hypothetical protein [Thiosulfatihalobacter marinus]
MAEPQPDPNRFSPDDYKALAPDMRATIRNPVAHSQFTELFLLLRPERAETLLAKGVTVDTFTKLKEVVAYYRSRAYGDAPRDHKLEAARRAVLGEIIQKVRSATK